LAGLELFTGSGAAESLGDSALQDGDLKDGGIHQLIFRAFKWFDEKRSAQINGKTAAFSSASDCLIDFHPDRPSQSCFPHVLMFSARAFTMQVFGLGRPVLCRWAPAPLGAASIVDVDLVSLFLNAKRFFVGLYQLVNIPFAGLDNVLSEFVTTMATLTATGH